METSKRKSINSATKYALMSIRMMKLFRPIKGHTNPLWYICSPFITSAYTKTSEFHKYSAAIDAEIAKRGVNRKKIIRDMTYSTIVFGATNDEYILYDFYGKSNDYRGKFFTTVKNFKMAMELNGEDKNELFNNKSMHMEKFPQFYRREWAVLNEEKDIPACIDFIEKHPKFLLKPDDGYQGAGIRLIEKDSIKDAEALLRDALKEGRWVLDECIAQHPFMSEMYPHSINTIRFHTMLGKNGKVRVFYPYLRLGRGGSIVDNYSAGGLTANVDTKTGVIFSELSGILPTPDVTVHPDTGCKITGRQIPFWEEVLQMLGEMARSCPDSRYLGWDMALSAERGWTLVEVNAAPGTTQWQSIENFGLSQEYADLQRWAMEGYKDEIVPHGQVEV